MRRGKLEAPKRVERWNEEVETEPVGERVERREHGKTWLEAGVMVNGTRDQSSKSREGNPVWGRKGDSQTSCEISTGFLQREDEGV